MYCSAAAQWLSVKKNFRIKTAQYWTKCVFREHQRLREHMNHRAQCSDANRHKYIKLEAFNADLFLPTLENVSLKKKESEPCPPLQSLCISARDRREEKVRCWCCGADVLPPGGLGARRDGRSQLRKGEAERHMVRILERKRRRLKSRGRGKGEGSRDTEWSPLPQERD